MFEHHTQPLASPAEFARRVLRYSSDYSGDYFVFAGHRDAGLSLF